MNEHAASTLGKKTKPDDRTSSVTKLGGHGLPAALAVLTPQKDTEPRPGSMLQTSQCPVAQASESDAAPSSTEIADVHSHSLAATQSVHEWLLELMLCPITKVWS